MTSQQRGPKKMEPSELDEFLRRPRLGSLCIEDADGNLDAMPTWVEGVDDGGVDLRVSSRARLSTAQSHACLVADEFSSYVGIRGVIVRGVLDPPASDTEPDRRRLRILHVHGFSFENTTVSL